MVMRSRRTIATPPATTRPRAEPAKAVGMAAAPVKGIAEVGLGAPVPETEDVRMEIVPVGRTLPVPTADVVPLTAY